MIDYEQNHLKADVTSLLVHITTARTTDDPRTRDEALFRGALRLDRLRKEIDRMGEVINEMSRARSG